MFSMVSWKAYVRPLRWWPLKGSSLIITISMGAMPSPDLAHVIRVGAHGSRPAWMLGCRGLDPPSRHSKACHVRDVGHQMPRVLDGLGGAAGGSSSTPQLMQPGPARRSRSYPDKPLTAHARLMVKASPFMPSRMYDPSVLLMRPRPTGPLPGSSRCSTDTRRQG